MIFYLFLVGCFANIAIASPINIEKQGLLKGYTVSLKIKIELRKFK